MCLTALATISCRRSSSRVWPTRLKLYYVLFTSGSKDDFDSSGAIPAMKLVEEEILKDPSILKGYALTHTPIKDIQASLLSHSANYYLSNTLINAV